MENLDPPPPSIYPWLLVIMALLFFGMWLIYAYLHPTLMVPNPQPVTPPPPLL